MPAAVVSTPHAQLPTGPMARSSQDVSPRTTYQNVAADAQERERRNNSTPVVVAEGPAPQAQAQTQQPHLDPSPNSKRTSPNALRPGPPKIVVKKEPPSSPENVSSHKHRPSRLDLTNSSTSRLAGPATAAPSLGMQDVGIACLSPGFQTQDPVMREQLQRSISVRDSQRALIESRLQKNNQHSGPKTGDRTNHDDRHDLPGPGGLKAPPISGKKRGPPPGLSIVAPAAHQFANDHRAIQSAPLGQTFTGRDQPHPAVHQRQVNGAPAMTNSGHAHQAGPTQPGNRLPPIGDVFGGMGVSGHPRSSPPAGQPGAPPPRPGLYHSQSSTSLGAQRPGAPQYPSSPGFPPPSSSSSNQQLAPGAAPPAHVDRTREYRSAEEAIAEMTQGEKERQPKLVHYHGPQPPTPPSPQQGRQGHTPTKHGQYLQGQQPQNYAPTPQSAAYPPTSAAAAAFQQPPPSGGGRVRPRSEYERDNGSPPLGSGPSPRGHRGPEFAHQIAAGFGPLGAGRDSPATQKQKKDEFLMCVARAWDLWHS